MIHLDTHVVVWLYQGDVHRLPSTARAGLGASRPAVSPIVRLELAYLQEIGRLTVSPAAILDALRVDADLRIADPSFERITAIAESLSWTRDPFDRLIAATALAEDLPLLTCDRRMLANCPLARWEDW